MKRAALVVALLAVPVLLQAQGLGVSSAAMQQTFLDYWQWRLAQEPELATEVGFAAYDDRWRDWSSAGRTRTRKGREAFVQRVLYIASGNLSPTERLSSDLLVRELRRALDAEPYLLLADRVSHDAGAHNQVFAVIGQMPSRTIADYENILARLRALPVHVDGHIDLMREQLGAGLAQPGVVVDRVIEQVARQARAPAAESFLLEAFRQFPDHMPEADRQRLRREAAEAYERQFVPSWTRLREFLSETYRPGARPEIALASVPNGRAAYDLLAGTYTGTSMTPEQIHAIGLAEVARLERDMQRVAREAGFDGSVLAFERHLRERTDGRFSSQEEMLAYARDTLSRVEREMPRLFARLPRATVGIRPISPDREAAASSYTPGAPDGIRDAWLDLNTHQPQEHARHRIDALVLHHTMPGHHVQVGLARELGSVPAFRRAIEEPAFSRGWALYAESLGHEIGTAYRDPAARFGQLASEQLRAAGLVVDTGIHAMGWSREQAVEYLSRYAPSGASAEVDRHIASPGKALAYTVGALKIRDLRRMAERELGSWFDIREFHDAVLRNGAVPFELLEPQVAAYIAATRAATVN